MNKVYSRIDRDRDKRVPGPPYYEILTFIDNMSQHKSRIKGIKKHIIAVYGLYYPYYFLNPRGKDRDTLIADMDGAPICVCVEVER